MSTIDHVITKLVIGRGLKAASINAIYEYVTVEGKCMFILQVL